MDPSVEHPTLTIHLSGLVEQTEIFTSISQQLSHRGPSRLRSLLPSTHCQSGMEQTFSAQDKLAHSQMQFTTQIKDVELILN
jgi:hypothetical protein